MNQSIKHEFIITDKHCRVKVKDTWRLYIKKTNPDYIEVESSVYHNIGPIEGALILMKATESWWTNE